MSFPAGSVRAQGMHSCRGAPEHLIGSQLYAQRVNAQLAGHMVRLAAGRSLWQIAVDPLFLDCFPKQDSASLSSRHATCSRLKPCQPSAAQRSHSCPPLPRLHPGVQLSPRQVTCPDRHGLLADVVRALKELPLEITTAAITTRRDHVVYDVFQARRGRQAGRHRGWSVVGR